MLILWWDFIPNKRKVDQINLVLKFLMTFWFVVNYCLWTWVDSISILARISYSNLSIYEQLQHSMLWLNLFIHQITINKTQVYSNKLKLTCKSRYAVQYIRSYIGRIKILNIHTCTDWALVQIYRDRILTIHKWLIKLCFHLLFVTQICKYEWNRDNN